MMLGGPQSRPGCCVEESNLLPSPSVEPRFHGRLVCHLAELPRLLPSSFFLFPSTKTPCGSCPSSWFRNSTFFRGEIVSPTSKPVTLEDQRLYLVWPLPFDLSGTGGPTRSLRSSQHRSPGHYGAQTSSPR
jgi:hypothetical protein